MTLGFEGFEQAPDGLADDTKLFADGTVIPTPLDELEEMLRRGIMVTPVGGIGYVDVFDNVVFNAGLHGLGRNFFSVGFFIDDFAFGR